MRLQEQYQRLYQAYGDAPAQPGLPQLAELWRCSERNARLQLARMRELGWLEWLAGRGRGKRSTLRLLQRPDELEWQKLQNMLARGQLEQAFSRLEPARQQRLLASLSLHLGAGDSGRSLRIPIPHAPMTLDPQQVNSRLEAHLVRQIFDRLCRHDKQGRELRPALAHSWESDAEGRHWRFWLRPGLRFHDGSALDAETAAASLLRLKRPDNPCQALYAHLQTVDVHDALSFSCQLAEPDQLWPQRLAAANASIVPRRRGADFARLPVGSGPFRVELHSPQRLKLAAFEQHYRERALLDAIELWIIPSPDEQDFHLRLEYGSHRGATMLQSACTYLLLRPGSRIAEDQRLPLMSFLAEPHPVAASDDRAPAWGLQPGWRHPRPESDKTPRLNVRGLTLFHYDLPCFPSLAAALAERLSGLGIALEIRCLSRREFFDSSAWRNQADLILCSEILHDDRDYGMFEWLSGCGTLRLGLDDAAAGRLAKDMRRLQGEAAFAAREDGYRRAGDWLVAEGWLLPLSHEQVGHSASPQLAGLQLGGNGWTDFSGLWLRA
ncbi:ABC transporter substrate-binding protein [Chromobacterium sp. IIBBL 290-4]|uniref:ABC transporter substrate-binding protein n=1 Tax=Chromobacterium sp. IIBBL 290-4 TaxID=2953890 RepID=UPI0020B8FD9D|nr:ABC transporter substrate-binding protein [Chromobacterium sp. IIBBL 290-4]UTH74875.1 ABC transporter substrate-binding protein [Chromobacterium sp. IIBBL 290-4]